MSNLWFVSAEPAPVTTALDREISAEVVIVGAGFTGCSAALHLAERGVRVVVLEAETIGHGGAGRNVGLVNAGMWVMPEELPKALGDVYGERLLTQLSDAPALVFELIEKHAIACESERRGTLHCGVGEKGRAELHARARQWRARGADVSLCEAADAHRLTGTDAYDSVLLDRRAGTIQPLAYVRGLARAAIAYGAKFFTRSAALERRAAGAGWRVTTARGAVTAKWVLLATDAYSTGAFASIAREQVRLPYFQVASAPLGDNLRGSVLPGRQGAWDTKQILSSFRLDAAGRLIFGSVGALRAGGRQTHRAWTKREIARLFPQLGGIVLEHEWFGMIGMTDDALPRLHRHDDNVYSISGYNGRGIAPGTTFGRDLARLVLGDVSVEDLSLPLTDLVPARLRGAREAFYELGAQIAHVAGARLPASKRSMSP